MHFLSEHIFFLYSFSSKDDQGSTAKAQGASCLEYEPTIPTKFMVGTEQGHDPPPPPPHHHHHHLSHHQNPPPHHHHPHQVYGWH